MKAFKVNLNGRNLSSRCRPAQHLADEPVVPHLLREGRQDVVDEDLAAETRLFQGATETGRFIVITPAVTDPPLDPMGRRLTVRLRSESGNDRRAA